MAVRDGRICENVKQYTSFDPIVFNVKNPETGVSSLSCTVMDEPSPAPRFEPSVELKKEAV